MLQICHSDNAVQQGLFGNSFPIVPGHEVIGEVAAVPDTEKRWKEGDRVGYVYSPTDLALGLLVQSSRRRIADLCCSQRCLAWWS